MKIAQISDTHIRNLKYHEQYESVFQELYKVLKKEKVGYIIHCGDIAHSKTQLSPEFVKVCGDFLSNLASIAPTYVILGNHDGNLRNSSREDAISPIVKALNLNNLYVLRDSCEVGISNNIVLNCLSIFDKDNWIEPTDPSKINIALYHGSVGGCKTDIGYEIHGYDLDISHFNKFDFAFLGDIHRTNQILDLKGKIRYPGSTIQQNFGESNDKGFLLWDIEDREDFTVKHIKLSNPNPFITIALTGDGKVPSLDIKPQSRIRVVSNHNIPSDLIKKSLDIVNSRYRPKSVIFLNKGRLTADSRVTGQTIENLRDIKVQEGLIKKYLENYEATDEILSRVLSLNGRYHSALEGNQDIKRNIEWKLKKVKWNNLFNYGEDNVVNFEKLRGIVGVFGKNYSGKSSIIDAMLFSLYNTTSKNSRKNVNIINQNKDSALVQVEMEIDGEDYNIERGLLKYTKKLHGKETEEAKVVLDFWRKSPTKEEPENLNGTTRTETDKNIKKHFGTFDDFILTSMASQFDSLKYLNEGSTKRKEILAKFLDLDMFDYKFKMAKEEASNTKGALKRLEGIDFISLIRQAQQSLKDIEGEIEDHKQKCEAFKESVEHNTITLNDVEESINSIPTENIDIVITRQECSKNKNLLKSLINTNEVLVEENVELKEEVSITKDFLSQVKIKKEKKRREKLQKKNIKINDLEHQIQKIEQRIKSQNNKMSLLKEVPCGQEFSHCKFISDAYSALEENKNTIAECDEVKQVLKEEHGDDVLKELEDIKNNIKKYETETKKRHQLEKKISENNLTIQTNKTRQEKLKVKIHKDEERIGQYEENREAIENLESLLNLKDKAEKEIAIDKKNIDICEEEMLELHKESGIHAQKLEHLKDQKEELDDLREEYSAYDLFMRCMHPNGISLNVIKQKLPIINEEISKVLSNIADFEIFLKNEEKKLDILIKHPSYEPRPIEMGSGAEKTIASMAIRLALLNITSLPRGDIFILDEPATALDEENMEGFIRMLDLVKSKFKTVLLISHLDNLKDCVDTQIVIEKIRGYAHVNE